MNLLSPSCAGCHQRYGGFIQVTHNSSQTTQFTCAVLITHIRTRISFKKRENKQGRNPENGEWLRLGERWNFLTSWIPYYLGLTNCAGRRQVRWPSPKIKNTRSRSRSPHKLCGPSPGVLAVAKDKRYALSGPSPGCADRRQRQKVACSTGLVQFRITWSLTKSRGRSPGALPVPKDKKIRIERAVARCAGRRHCA